MKKKGHAREGSLKIFELTADRNYKLNEPLLKKLLLADETKDCNVCVISVAGAYRKGKSFILNFFLRYLQYYDSKKKTKPDDNESHSWLGNRHKPLNGFSWKGGYNKRSGIQIWPEIYYINETAVILLDTQGLFDSNSAKDWATVFTLSTLISSVQIYNVTHNINENDLQKLNLLIDYGRLSLTVETDKPFQKLQFLVRDWGFSYEFEYGSSGGDRLLDSKLMFKQDTDKEVISVRKYIKSCFEEIKCYLMPTPGFKASGESFDGKLSDMDFEYVRNMSMFVPSILSSASLTIKEVAGQKIKAKELFIYMKNYTKVLNSREYPDSKSILNATAEANHLAAISAAKDAYSDTMDIVVGINKPYLNRKCFQTLHITCKKISMTEFNSYKKIGEEEFTNKFRLKLSKDLEVMYKSFWLKNESKDKLRPLKTITVLISCIFIMYIISLIFLICKFVRANEIAENIMKVFIAILFIWALAVSTGDSTELAYAIDTAADKFWDLILKQNEETCNEIVKRLIETNSNKNF